MLLQSKVRQKNRNSLFCLKIIITLSSPGRRLFFRTGSRIICKVRCKTLARWDPMQLQNNCKVVSWQVIVDITRSEVVQTNNLEKKTKFVCITVLYASMYVKHRSQNNFSRHAGIICKFGAGIICKVGAGIIRKVRAGTVCINICTRSNPE